MQQSKYQSINVRDNYLFHISKNKFKSTFNLSINKTPLSFLAITKLSFMKSCYTKLGHASRRIPQYIIASKFVWYILCNKNNICFLTG